MKRVLHTVAAVAILALPALAQNAISARAGMINVADGDVWISDAKGGEPTRVDLATQPSKLTNDLDIENRGVRRAVAQQPHVVDQTAKHLERLFVFVLVLRVRHQACAFGKMSFWGACAFFHTMTLRT